MKLLGVKFTNLKKESLLNKFDFFLHNQQANLVFTPNPEMLVLAQKDKDFKSVLNQSDLNLCDGRGVELVLKYLYQQNIQRLPGVDVMNLLLKYAEENNLNVYFLGSGSKQILNKLITKTLEKFPKLKIVGSNPGPKIDIKGQNLIYDLNLNNEILADISLKNTQILFVAFGQIKQEKWLYKHKLDLPTVNIAIGVGGAFDFLAQKTKRAPLFLRKIGLEWLWRLILQPWRWRRIFRAVIIFPFLALKEYYGQKNH